MPPINLPNLEPSDDFLVSLGKNVWLMDNHRWALLVWEEQRTQEKYSLVHADQHWDAVYNFYKNEEAEQELVRADVARIKEYLVKDELICYDSFIAPAVRRGLFDAVHFFCTEDYGNDIGLYDEFLKETSVVQIVHSSVVSLAETRFKYPVIFDLCLDLFNRSDQWMEGDLWKLSEIRSFLESVRHIISAAEIVTVSLSFNFSGTHEDTRTIAQLVIPLLLSYRSDT